jgi:hypothetical protein
MLHYAFFKLRFCRYWGAFYHSSFRERSDHLITKYVQYNFFFETLPSEFEHCYTDSSRRKPKLSPQPRILLNIELCVIMNCRKLFWVTLSPRFQFSCRPNFSSLHILASLQVQPLLSTPTAPLMRHCDFPRTFTVVHICKSYILNACC